MAIARLQFSGYQSSNENGGGDHAWSNVQGAGSTNEAGGAYTVRDPNSANMNWLRSQGDGARGSATIPAGSTIKGIVVGFKIHQYNGAQSGGNYVVQLFQFSSPVGTAKTGSIAQGATVGPFGSPTDLWGLTGLTPTSFSNIYFGHHCNFPSISSDITVYSWDGYMDIYYDEAVPLPAAISAVGGNNQSAQINTAFTTPLTAYVTDQGGNPRPLVNVTFTLPASGASGLFSNATRFCNANTNSLGIATSLVITANGTTGAWQPVADVTGSSPLIFTTFNLTNNPVPVVKVPTTMTIVQGSGQSAPVSTTFPLALKVVVKDQFAQPYPNAGVLWSPPGSGASGTFIPLGNPALTSTDSQGIATAPTLVAGSVSGSWTLPVAVNGTPGVNTSFSFSNIPNVAPPAPTTLLVIQGSNQTTNINAIFPIQPVVRILDQRGSPYAGGVAIQGQVPNLSSGRFNNNPVSLTYAVVSDGSGLSNFGNVQAGAAPNTNWAINFSVPSVPGIAVVQLTGLNNVDPSLPAGITAVSGQGQSAAASAAFANPLRARVANGSGTGLAGVSVTFTCPPSGASCTISGSLNPIVVTDANGYAQTAANPVANATTGGYNVVASIAGGFSTNFNLTNGDGYVITPVCTAQEALPASAGVGIGGGNAWSNPQNMGATGGGGTFASVAVAPSNAPTQFLLAQPKPASWSAINPAARVTSLAIRFFYRDFLTSPNVLNSSFFTEAIMNGAADTTNWQFVSFAAIAGGAFNQSAVQTINAVGPTYFTVAQLLAANFGVAITVINSGTQTPASTVSINGATVSFCYRLPDGSVAVSGSVPLLLSQH